MLFKNKIKLSLATIALLANTMYADESVNELGDVTVVEKSTITENSDSYNIPSMSTSTKMNLSSLDTPQSVSVVTSQQMEDFGLNSINDALQNATGIEVNDLEKDRTFYTSRGFQISNILVDGVGGSITSNIYINGDIDMILYDHIEVTRGAAGLSSNNGDPSATINMITKRPTKDTQTEIKATVGSWNKTRLEADVSGAISEDKSLRARLIGAIESAESYTDRYESNSNVFGLIVEKDINDKHLLTATITRAEDNNDDTEQGGMDSLTAQNNYDVSTTTAPNWAFRDVETTEFGLKLDSSLSDTWKAKTTYKHKEVKHDAQFLTVWNNGTSTYLESFKKTDEDLEEDLLDISLNKTYTLNGKEHELVFGLSAIKQEYTDLLYSDSTDYNTAIDLNTWNGSTSTPDFSSDPSKTDWSLDENSIYAATNYNILDNLSILVGSKITSYKQNGIYSDTDYKVEESSIATPYASLLYKTKDNLSTYISHTTTFDPQNNFKEDGSQLDPEEGTNTEIGVKSSLLDDKLNFAFSLFKAEQNNFAVWAGWDSANNRSYYTDTDLKTEGYDIELAGSVNDSINLSLGYTHLTSVENADGEAQAEYLARTLLKTSLTYSPAQVKGLKVGASANYTSKTNNGRDESNDFYLEQKAFTLYNIMTSYQINKKTKISFNANNITDEKYFNTMLKPYVTYGSPRSYEVSLAYKF